ncbi:RES family NAD+ phosphorylase [Paenibacillus sp. NPDC057886]|uniref:RES family NAD+ phosphorylase n=1 Tax=Paenibacillus sp. NPDC057886 TaxID=3346270 RepID=UPI0036B1AB12
MIELQEFVDNNIESCELCNKDYFEFLDEQNEDVPSEICIPVWNLLSDLDIPVETWARVEIKCPSCKNKLLLDSSLITDTYDFENWTEARAVELLSDEVCECDACNSGEIPSTQKYGDPADLNTLWDLFNEYGVPEKLRSKIDGLIECKCGAILDIDKPYLTQGEVDFWYGEEFEGDFSGKIISTFDIESEKAEDFTKLLIKYPMMALEHEVGRKIYESFNAKSVKGLVSYPAGTVLYRGRKRNNIERHVPYVESELWAPPEGVPGQGRYNPSGVPVLYLTDTKTTALKEIGLTDGQTAEIGCFITLRPITIWDIDNLDLDEFVSLPSLNHSTISKEYVFPNFLAQCAGKAGINGIKYKSVKQENSFNIALLNYFQDINLHFLSNKIETYNHDEN